MNLPIDGSSEHHNGTRKDPQKNLFVCKLIAVGYNIKKINMMKT